MVIFFPLFPFFVFRVNASRRLPQASARRLPFGHPRICSQITGDSALQCWSGCEISPRVHHFYSRPCGRGDGFLADRLDVLLISTHAPAGGATFVRSAPDRGRDDFYSRPCGRGDTRFRLRRCSFHHFYSRPCGRGDRRSRASASAACRFLLTPLREGRLDSRTLVCF